MILMIELFFLLEFDLLGSDDIVLDIYEYLVV